MNWRHVQGKPYLRLFTVGQAPTGPSDSGVLEEAGMEDGWKDGIRLEDEKNIYGKSEGSEYVANALEVTPDILSTLRGLSWYCDSC